MTAERVEEWRKNIPYRPLYGDAVIRHVDELDQASRRPRLTSVVETLSCRPSLVIAVHRHRPRAYGPEKVMSYVKQD
jgi:hypothetical protein